MADGQVVINTRLDNSGLEAGIGNLANATQRGVEKIKKTLASVGVALSATAIVASVNKMVDSVAADTDRIDKLSQKIGMSRKSFQEWDYILEQSGASVDGLQMGVKTLSDAADAADSGTKQYADDFKALGVSVTDANGNLKDQGTLFDEVFAALSKVENPTKRAALANDLLGKSASELAPILNAGSTEVDRLRERAYKLGKVLDDETINAGVAFGDALNDIKVAGTMLLTKTLTPMIKTVSDLGSSFAEALGGSSDAKKKLASKIDGLVSDGLDSLSTAIDTKLTPYLTSLFNSIPDAITQLADKIAEYGPKMVVSGIKLIASLAEGMYTNLPAILQSVVDGLLEIGSSIVENAGYFAAAGEQLLSSIWDGIKTAFVSFATNVGIIFGTIISIWDYIDWKSLGTDLLEKIWTGLKNAWSWFYDKVKSVFTDLWDAIKSGFKNGKRIGEDAGTAITEGLDDGIDTDKPINSIDKLIQSLVVASRVSKAEKNGKSLSEAVSDGLFDGLDAFQNAADNLVAAGVIEPIKLKIPELEKTGEDAADAVANGLGSTTPKVTIDTKTAEKSLKDFTEELKQEASSWSDFFYDSAQTIYSAFGSAFEAIGEVIGSYSSTLSDLEDSLTDTLSSLSDAQDDLADAQEDYNDAVLSGDSDAIKSAKKQVEQQQKIVAGYEDQVDSVNDEITALKNGTTAWESFGQVALQALSSVLEGLGAELAARAVVSAIALNWTGAALATAGSVAAYLAAGVLSGYAGSFATGGIVPGSSYSGDNLTANVNSGELILNATQQEAVASQLAAMAKLTNLLASSGANGNGGIGITINLQGSSFNNMNEEAVGKAIYRNVKGLQNEGILPSW